MSHFLCHHCKTSIEFSGLQKIGRRDSCANCLRDLHACLNCQHFDAAANRECREHVPERVNDKEKSNFCDFFEPNQNSTSAPKSNTARDVQMSAAEALFKKS